MAEKKGIPADERKYILDYHGLSEEKLGKRGHIEVAVERDVTAQQLGIRIAGQEWKTVGKQRITHYEIPVCGDTSVLTVSNVHLERPVTDENEIKKLEKETEIIERRKKEDY